MRAFLIAVVLAAVCASAANASAPPVGPLPKGPIATIAVTHGEVFAVALPATGGGGRVWRIARQYDGRMVTEVSEGVQRGHIVAVYRALRPGRTKIVYALTLGERTKALKARTFAIVVR
jgi:hypothetical protein